MNYVLTILKERADVHKKEIDRLKAQENDVNFELFELDEELKNHELYIKQIQDAINKILK